MKKTIVLSILAGIITVFAWNCNQNTETRVLNESTIFNAFCDSTDPHSPCSKIPLEVNERFPLGYTSFLDSAHQTPFDVFAWQSFIALNWPSDKAGNPVGSIYDQPNSLRVWEYYQDPAQVFGHNNQSLANELKTALQRGEKFFYMDSKAPVPTEEEHSARLGDVAHGPLKGFLEADGFPLIDRNLNFVLYEIKLNPTETSYIINNKLTTKEGIYAYGVKHENALDLPASNKSTQDPGAIEVKASWRILVPSQGDDTSRYFCRRATVFIDSAHTVSKKPLVLKNVLVGLVGMHIIRKTPSTAMKQVWATFEHIDNTPDNPQEAQQSGRRWSFYNPACLNCIPNDTPSTRPQDNKQYLWNDSMPYASLYGVDAPGQASDVQFGTQVVRGYPIYKFTEMTNNLWQGKLKGSVWANYRLIGTQWQKGDSPNPPTAPHYLANTTLETYIPFSSSCINCHSFAAVKVKGTKITTDLSFVFPVYAQDSAAHRLLFK
jgi:hypothetical protein